MFVRPVVVRTAGTVIAAFVIVRCRNGIGGTASRSGRAQIDGQRVAQGHIQNRDDGDVQNHVSGSRLSGNNGIGAAVGAPPAENNSSVPYMNRLPVEL